VGVALEGNTEERIFGAVGGLDAGNIEAIGLAQRDRKYG